MAETLQVGDFVETKHGVKGILTAIKKGTCYGDVAYIACSDMRVFHCPVSDIFRTVIGVTDKAPAADVVVSKIENTTQHGENITKMNPVDEFICSECGLIMRDLTEVRIDEDNEDECYFEFEFKYCPNCGVKIKERE